MKYPESVVIVKWRQGFVAHVRYTDGKGDADLSATTPAAIHYVVNKHVKEQS